MSSHTPSATSSASPERGSCGPRTLKRAISDRGSVTLETIVIAALIFGAAVGAVAAIIAAISKFQGMLG